MKTAKRSGRSQPVTKKQPAIKAKGKMSNGYLQGQSKGKHADLLKSLKQSKGKVSTPKGKGKGGRGLTQTKWKAPNEHAGGAFIAFD